MVIIDVINSAKKEDTYYIRIALHSQEGFVRSTLLPGEFNSQWRASELAHQLVEAYKESNYSVGLSSVAL